MIDPRLPGLDASRNNSLFASPHVRQARMGERLILADLSSGQYFLLNPVAAAMWSGLAGEFECSEALDLLRRRYYVEEAQLATDLACFRQECMARGLLRTHLKPDHMPGRRPLRNVLCPILAAWLWLLRCSSGIRRKSFHAIWLLAIEQAPAQDGPADGIRLAHAVAAFSHAELFYTSPSSPNDCLPRSLALYAFLRSMGLPAEHCLGFEPDIARAHAWVECNGNVILDIDRRSELIKLVAVGT